MGSSRKSVVLLAAAGLGAVCIGFASPLGAEDAGQAGTPLYSVAPSLPLAVEQEPSPQAVLPTHPPTFWGQEWLRRTAQGTEPFIGAMVEEPGLFRDGGVWDRGFVMGDPPPQGLDQPEPHLWVRLRAVGLGEPWSFIALLADGRGWIERNNTQTLFGPLSFTRGAMPPGSEWVHLWIDEQGQAHALLRSLDGAFLAHVGLDVETGAVVGIPASIRQSGPKAVQSDGGFVEVGEVDPGRFSQAVSDQAWHVGAVAVQDGVVLWEGMWEPDPWDKSQSRRTFWVMDTRAGWVSEIPTTAPVPFTPSSDGAP